MNIGSMTNSGVEVDLAYNILHTKDITWDVNLNATFIKNKINELHPDLKGKLIDSPLYTKRVTLCIACLSQNGLA